MIFWVQIAKQDDIKNEQVRDKSEGVKHDSVITVS